MLLEWLQSFPDALNQYCGFWCGFASVGMLPAVYCGLESSALPYSHTGQKPANETGLQGVTYRPCWCFRLFKKNSPKKKRWRCYHKAECHSNCIIVHHLKEWKKERKCGVKGEGESGREREKEYLLLYKMMVPTLIQIEQMIQQLILETTRWGNSTKLPVMYSYGLC